MKLFFSIMVCLISTKTFAQSLNDQIQNCYSTKEYITTFRYLEDKKIFLLKKEDIMKVADVVSQGCDGAAKRFIEITDLLVKSKVETSESIKLAIEFSKKNDQASQAFIAIFKEKFLKEYLDLDIKSAIDFSKKLSLETDGDPNMIKNDFQKIVKFCLDQNSLDLSGPRCSELASKVVQSGTKFKTEMSSVFLDHFDFLTDSKGVSLPTYKALEISLKLINAGQLSAVNFKDAYKFAISKSGLDLTKVAAINYAELMAQRSVLETSSK